MGLNRKRPESSLSRCPTCSQTTLYFISFPPYYLQSNGWRKRWYHHYLSEKYLAGGWLNRIALSLASQLPNEIDWAFTKLMKLTHTNIFFIGYIPQLPQILFEILESFFGHLSLHSSPHSFLTTGDESVPPMYAITLFNSGVWDVQVERVLQRYWLFNSSLHIIRNLTCMPENALAFGKDPTLLILLAKGN